MQALQVLVRLSSPCVARTDLLLIEVEDTDGCRFAYSLRTTHDCLQRTSKHKYSTSAETRSFIQSPTRLLDHFYKCKKAITFNTRVRARAHTRSYTHRYLMGSFHGDSSGLYTVAVLETLDAFARSYCTAYNVSRSQKRAQPRKYFALSSESIAEANTPSALPQSLAC